MTGVLSKFEVINSLSIFISQTQSYIQNKNSQNILCNLSILPTQFNFKLALVIAASRILQKVHLKLYSTQSCKNYRNHIVEQVKSVQTVLGTFLHNQLSYHSQIFFDAIYPLFLGSTSRPFLLRPLGGFLVFWFPTFAPSRLPMPAQPLGDVESDYIITVYTFI